MDDQTPSSVLGALPRARSHRRSPNRPRRSGPTVDPSKTTAEEHTDPVPPSADGGFPLLATAAQALAELTEAGLSLSAYAIRSALARLPRA